MPTYDLIRWADVAPGDTIVGKTGKPVLIRARPTYWHISTRDGTFVIDPDSPCLRARYSPLEALLALAIAFPGAKVVPSDEP